MKQSFPVTLFITRKYPPGRGGMEVFSHRLYAEYPGGKYLIAHGRSQAWLPLFLVCALIRSARHRGRVDHTHLGDAMLTPLAPLVRALTGTPVTATVHGLDVTRDLLPYRWLLSKSLRSVDGGLIAVSRYTATRAERLAGVHPHVISNGVDVDRFQSIGRAANRAALREELGLRADGPLIMTVGRLVERKGVEWFIRYVMPRLPADGSFAVVGAGPHDGAVRRAAAADRRVTLFGAADEQAVRALYRCADLFVAPNIAVPNQPEGYGIAPAEAAAAGIPVLASDIEGLRDMAHDAGIRLVRAGDPDAWTAAVRAAIADPAYALPAKQPRSWQEVALDYARAFAEVSAERKGRFQRAAER